MNYCALIIVLILIFAYVSDSILIGSQEDLVYFYNSTNNYDYLSDAIGRYKRQHTDNSVDCQIPTNPLHAKYIILGDSQASYKAGDLVSEFRILELHCNDGYAISPFQRNISICINKSWSPSPTTCVRTCPSLISTKTTTVKCQFNNHPLENCINPIMGTIAVLSCNALYEDANIQRNPVRVCRESRWDPSISTCYPTCGNKHPKGNVNIIGGENVTVGDYPWQIGLYSRTTKTLLCGGSIIEQNIILTAAHCVTDYEGNVQPVVTYMVAAGKYFSRYDEPKDVFAQYSNVLAIHVPERYTGRINSFAQDIAVIILSVPFTLSEGVQPVCIELNEDPSHLHFLPEGNNGVVSGWGYTIEMGAPSEVLKELVIPLIPFDICSRVVPDNFRRYITVDKICGGYINNETSVCRGDSGGALVFRNLLDNRYFAKGIVSTSPATEVLTCDSNQYSLYTSVDQHIPFVRSLVALNQYRTSIECFNDECENEEIEEKKGSHCPSPPNPVNGKYSPNNFPDEYTPGTNLLPLSVLTLSCDTGYNASPLGATQFLCGDDGQWSPDLGICTKQNHIPPPEIFPEGEEYTINATQNFSLKCAGKNFVTWTAPNNLENNVDNIVLKYSTITIQSSKTSDSETSYESVLTITNASYLDVGYYYCHENISDFNDLSKVSKIYLYVYDPQKLSLLTVLAVGITVNQQSKAVLPCRPTSPDIKVDLRQITGDEMPIDRKDEFGNITTYNPKTGYTMRKVQSNGEIFECIFTRGNIEQYHTIFFTTEPPSIPKPLLEEISDGSTIVGVKLMLKCKLKYSGQFTMNWDVPNKIRIQSGQIRFSRVTKLNNEDEYFQDLEIENSTIADLGQYTCIVRNSLHENNATKFIRIFDTTELI